GRHTRFSRDWSSDVCSSDLVAFNLEREGFRVLSVGLGRKAVELASGDPRPDLVVLDLMLPDISGTEVCRMLRQNTDTRRTPIIKIGRASCRERGESRARGGS